MSSQTAIQWTDSTFNPIRGCTKVSPGCTHCYAAREAIRFPRIRGVWGDAGTRILAVPTAWKEPARWNRTAGEILLRASAILDDAKASSTNRNWALDQRRPRVFCASLADIFEDWKGLLHFPSHITPVSITPAFWDGHQLIRELEDSAQQKGYIHATMDHMRIELFRLIESTPYLDWQLLTKRPQNVMRMVPPHWQTQFPDNVWIGTTAEDQQRADERIPHLLSIPAKVRFLSCEPLLGPIDFSNHTHRADFAQRLGKSALAGIHWIICGGESGPKARPMHPSWPQSIRDQCAAAQVPFFFKQWGEYSPTCPINPKGQFDYSKCVTVANDGTLYQPGDITYPDGPRYGEAIRKGHDKAALTIMHKIGKSAAGHELDKVIHQHFPSL